MKSTDLSTEDAGLLLAAFRAAADGPFFPDWEFHTLMGFHKVDLRQLIAKWPTVTDEGLFALAVNNVLNNLLGYPHGEWDAWREYSSATPKDLARLITLWRGESTFDTSERGHFERLQ